MMKTLLYRLCFLWILTVLIPGCANPLNSVTYQRYYQAGLAAEQSYQYEMAKENYYRALENVRIGNLGPQQHAEAAYSLGRMLGILCDHKNAELMLTEALKYDKETSGPVYLSLFELAFLKYDQENYSEAASYLGQAIPLVDNETYIKADPGQFVDYFTLYATVLQKLGRNEEAKSFSSRAKALSAQYPDAKPKAGRTPYNKNCNKLR